jgi:hypothetical protein
MRSLHRPRDFEFDKVKGELAELETELGAIVQKLDAVETERGRYVVKPLDERSAQENEEIARLSEDKRKLRELQSNLQKKQNVLLANASSQRASHPVLVPLAAKLQERGLRMVSPRQVRYPLLGGGEPPFCAEEGWLERLTATVVSNLTRLEATLYAGEHKLEEKIDIADPDRIPLLAFIRCSRGGKTRALMELAGAFNKARSDAAILFVSCNDDTPLAAWELDDPLGALCRRIAFSALDIESRSEQVWLWFRNALVTSTDVTEWLGNTPCLLLIDKLNLFTMTGPKAAEVADFLRVFFLRPAGRYFVFSSHVVPASDMLSAFMDIMSARRKVIIWELPLVWRMAEARTKLGWPTITAREVLARGRLPGLIAVSGAEVARGVFGRSVNRDAVVASLSGKWDDASALSLLRSFLDGSTRGLMEPILQFMNASSQGRIIWVPSHTEPFLDDCRFSTHLSPSLRLVLLSIATVMSDFERGKTAGGDSWEALFVVALLIRLVTASSHELLFIEDLLTRPFHVSYNANWSGNVSFEFVSNVRELRKGMVVPRTLPHVAVYYPPLATFALYDVVVAVYDESGARTLRGYQLKEGKALPKVAADAACKHSVSLRGTASRKKSGERQWTVASDESIDSFLGVTGATLAPKSWRELEDADVSLKKPRRKVKKD